MFTKAIELDSKNHVLYSNRYCCTSLTFGRIIYDFSYLSILTNRSAAFTSLKQYKEAVQDAEKTISLKGDWAKGYGRKGAALHGLGDLEEAAKAYEEGLKIDPANALLKKGLEDVERFVHIHILRSNSIVLSFVLFLTIDVNNRAMNDSPLSSLGNMFGPDMWAKLAANPKLSPYLSQPDVVNMLQECQKDPKNMSK